MNRFTSDDRNDEGRGLAPAERNEEGDPVGLSFEGVVGEGPLSRRRMLKLAGGALAGVLLTPFSLSGGEATANSERIRRVLPPYLRVSPSLQHGVYTIQQKSSGKFVDAHESSDHDFGVVTRTDQNNDTQRWTIKPG
jgi:hypothetical protein